MKQQKLAIILMLATALFFTACDTGTGDIAAPDIAAIAAIGGVTPPATGGIPVTVVTETDQYRGIVSWSDSPVTFEIDKSYRATITLTAKTGYSEIGVPANFFTVAGALLVSNNADSGIVTAVFPATGEPGTVVNLAAIPGVTAPVFGAIPVATITETAQYTGTVIWNGNPATFAAGTPYTATISLTARDGYILNSVEANFFTVAGATSVSNPLNSGVITAAFRITPSYVSATIGNMMAVAGGTFNNGTANMTVSSFRMSQHEVTGEQYAAVMGLTDPSSFSAVTNNPVETVNWYAALVFCNKLSMAESLTPVYTISGSTDSATWGAIPMNSDTTWNAATADWSANGYRLPTEAEWKFAARGGNNTNYYTYAGSNTIDAVAWYYTNSGSTTHTVGGLAANELGLYDMSGNVYEWCWDWYAEYPTGTQSNYRGAASGTHRIIGHGSWKTKATYCTVMERWSSQPHDQYSAAGFRVVRP